jgi:hypothetical protein
MRSELVWITSGIADNSNRKSSCETTQTDGDTGSKLQKTLMQRHLFYEVPLDDDAGDQPVDTQDLCHDGAKTSAERGSQRLCTKGARVIAWYGRTCSASRGPDARFPRRI